MIKRVTFSGIDAWTKAQDILAIYEKYPFTEFAYLYTESKKAGNRYPQPVILKAFKKARIPMAVHICGKAAHEVMKTGDWSPVYASIGQYMDMFERIQINIPKTSHFSRNVVFPEGKKIIIQIHPGTEEMFECYKTNPSVQGFQDGSGGHGITASEWMPPETEFFGYAGGIGPENVVETIRKISSVCRTDFWIDMETGIRTNDKFDVKKCEQVCKAIVEAGFIK